MPHPPTELAAVFYDARKQWFEAKVTVYGESGPATYVCCVHGPVSMRFRQAAALLSRQALEKHGKRSGLRSFVAPNPPARVKVREERRRGLPEGQYGFFRGRAA